jgi:hypothetical protein
VGGAALAMMYSTTEPEGSQGICAPLAGRRSLCIPTTIDGPTFDDELRAPGYGALGPLDWRPSSSSTTAQPDDARATAPSWFFSGTDKSVGIGGRRCLLADHLVPFSVRGPGSAQPQHVCASPSIRRRARRPSRHLLRISRTPLLRRGAGTTNSGSQARSPVWAAGLAATGGMNE